MKPSIFFFSALLWLLVFNAHASPKPPTAALQSETKPISQVIRTDKRECDGDAELDLNIAIYVGEDQLTAAVCPPTRVKLILRKIPFYPPFLTRG